MLLVTSASRTINTNTVLSIVVLLLRIQYLMSMEYLVLNLMASVLCVFTAWHYANAICAVVSCRSTCPLQAGVVTKLQLLNINSWKQSHLISQGLQFSDVIDLGKTATKSPPTGAPYIRGVR